MKNCRPQWISPSLKWRTMLNNYYRAPWHRPDNFSLSARRPSKDALFSGVIYRRRTQRDRFTSNISMKSRRAGDDSITRLAGRRFLSLLAIRLATCNLVFGDISNISFRLLHHRHKFIALTLRNVRSSSSWRIRVWVNHRVLSDVTTCSMMSERGPPTEHADGSLVSRKKSFFY